MSERIHSPNAAPAGRPRRRLISYVTGTVVLLAAAGVGLQFFRANPAASQTNDPRAAGTAAAPSDVNAKPVAKVNGQPITYAILAKECVGRHGEDVLDSLINRLMIEQECQRKGIAVTQQEIEQEVASTAKKFNLPLDTWYKMLEAERGLNAQQYHRDIIWPMLALKKLAGQKVEVTEEDMKRGFERDYGPRVEARMILVNGNVRQAGQIFDRCNANPDEFDRIAREVSADPNTRPLGGVIPPIRKHGGNKNVEDQAFRMRPGEISPVIQIQENSYVILKCEGFTDPVVTDIREVWEELYQQLVEEKTQVAVAQVFEQIQKSTRVDNFLTGKSTGGETPIQQTGGLRPPTSVQPARPAGGTR